MSVLALLFAALASQSVDVHSRPLREERSRNFDILHYRIELSLEESSKSFTGTTTIRMTALQEGLARCVLDAETFLVERVEDESSQALAFTHANGVLTVSLARPVAFGAGCLECEESSGQNTSQDTVRMPQWPRGNPPCTVSRRPLNKAQ